MATILEQYRKRQNDIREQIAANSLPLDQMLIILMRQSSPRICLVRRLHHAEVELRPLIKTQLAKEQIIYLCADIADENSKNPMEK